MIWGVKEERVFICLVGVVTTTVNTTLKSLKLCLKF